MRPLSWLRPLAARLSRTPARRVPQRPAFRPGVEGLEDRSVPATFNVTNTLDPTDTNDSNYVGSLRWAVNQANATPGADTIGFAIPGGGTHTIQPQTVLPAIAGPVVVDGYTQPGASANTLAIGDDAAIRIILDGSQTPPGAIDGIFIGQEEAYGLLITAGGSTVQGLQIQGFEVGVHVFGPAASGSIVQGNFFNTDGTQVVGAALDSQVGVVIENASGNTLGGTTPAARNLVWAPDIGILIGGDIPDGTSGNVVAGNYIGLNAAGTGGLTGASTTATGHLGLGVWLISADDNTVGGTDPGARNVIAGPWDFGVVVANNVTPPASGHVVVTGNYIGTNAAGTAAATGPGIDSGGAGIDGNEDGTLISHNLVSGCGNAGIHGSGPHTQVLDNLVGTDVTGSQPIPNGSEIVVDTGATASGNTVGFDPAASITSASLQQALSPGGGTVVVQATTQQAANDVVAAVNGLSPPDQPVTVSVNLGGGNFTGVTASPPANVPLVFQNGTFNGHSPALTVTSGVVVVRNCTLTNATDAPTILVTGGSLTLRGDVVQESTGYDQVAVLVTGGTADLGTAADPGGNTINVNGTGSQVRNTTATPVSTVGNAWDVNGSAVSGPVVVKAVPTIAVSGGTFVYDEQPHPASGSVTGVNGESLGAPAFTYSYTDDDGHVVTSTTPPTDPGYYTVTASFAGNANYNPASATSTITIVYEARTLTDLSRAFNAGRTIPIKIQLLDANGNNLSSSGIDLTAVRLERVNADGSVTQVSLQDAGNANPNNLFRYDAALGGYIFNLSTKGLGAGTYHFFWMAEGDPTEHELDFRLV